METLDSNFVKVYLGQHVLSSEVQIQDPALRNIAGKLPFRLGLASISALFTTCEFGRSLLSMWMRLAPCGLSSLLLHCAEAGTNASLP